MALYHVTITSKPTLTQEGEAFVVKYESPNYTEAWVGARTVCRLGTIFKDDPRCKNPKNAREFWTLDNAKFPLSPATHIVRSIFAENTRKTGKQRMTNISFDDLKRVLESSNIKMSKKLEESLGSVVNDSGGLRVTMAVARRLGLDEENDE